MSIFLIQSAARMQPITTDLSLNPPMLFEPKFIQTQMCHAHMDTARGSRDQTTNRAGVVDTVLFLCFGVMYVTSYGPYHLKTPTLGCVLLVSHQLTPLRLPSRPQVRRRPEAEQLAVSRGGRRLQRLDSASGETEAAAPAGAQPGRRGG